MGSALRWLAGVAVGEGRWLTGVEAGSVGRSTVGVAAGAIGRFGTTVALGASIWRAPGATVGCSDDVFGSRREGVFGHTPAFSWHSCVSWRQADASPCWQACKS